MKPARTSQGERYAMNETVNIVRLRQPDEIGDTLTDILRSGARKLLAQAIEMEAEAYAKAVDCLTKDQNASLAFYDFPAEHWDHLRRSNPIESVFATVRHRTVRTKGSLSSTTAQLMVFKLVMAAARTWRRLKGQNQLPKLIAGARFLDGIEVIETKPQSAA
ncbi:MULTISPECIES: transposase [Mesorhizobium]|uniref:transposase n=2 Tax=Mesorhizobium sp. TaxID=1871066 RepID=UPI002E319BB5|nr:transposase [Mesorhizobium muleiense]